MTAVRRRIALAILIFAAILVAAYTAYWFHVAGLVGKAVVAWSDERRAAGWQVGYEHLETTGFPLWVTARLDKPAIDAPGGLGWQAEQLSARARPFDLGHVTLSAPGRHRLSFGPLAATATADELQAELAFDSAGGLRQAHAVARAVAVEGMGDPAAGADSLALSLERPAPPAGAVTEQTPVLIFAASAAGVRLPALPGFVLGRRVASAEVAGRVLGPVPPPTKPTEGPLDALQRWSAAGGTVAVDRLTLDWEPMVLEAEGTVALDPGLQPRAAFSARVRGYGQLMDRLAAAHMVDPGAANAAKLVLTLMAKPDSQGRPAIPVPVTMQDGRLWLGPAAVATVPAIAWPAPLVRPDAR